MGFSGERKDSVVLCNENDQSYIDYCSKTSDAVEEFLRYTLGNIRPEDLRLLRKNVRVLGASIDYDDSYQEFANLYWLRNYWKAVYGLKNYVSLDNVRSVLVFGSGSGSDTAALLAVMNERYPGRKLRITMVDRNKKQQEFARTITNIVQESIGDTSTEFLQNTQDILDWEPKGRAYDLVMVNHVLTENLQNISRIIDISLKGISPHGSLFITERDRDPIWTHTKKLIVQRGFTVNDASIDRTKLDHLLMPLGSKAGQYLDMTPHYLVVSPHRPQ